MKTSRKRRILRWTLGGILFLFLYPLTVGPLMAMTIWLGLIAGIWLPDTVIDTICLPTFWVGYTPLRQPLLEYVEWWAELAEGMLK